MDASGWQAAFAERHQLPASYLDYAQQWFAPLASTLASHQSSAGTALLVGVNGAQGSGKTTLCDYLRENLAACHGKRAVCLSLDDFYLTRERRQRLSEDVHPLLAVRGVPGTHDMKLLAGTLDHLLLDGARSCVAIPRFDKARDDRKPREDWDSVSAPVDIVLLEGWCLGIRPEPEDALAQPVNALERQDDPGARWRRYVNDTIRTEFNPLYQRIEHWVMLCAPSFDCVYRWRQEQEQKLAMASNAGGAGHIMNDEQLARFIQFYERITRRCLEQLPPLVQDLYRLDAERRVVGETHRQIASS